MIGRPRRLLSVAAAAVMILTTVTLVELDSTSRVAAEALARSGTAATNLADCVDSVGRLDVLFLIDESGSLGGPDGTDPTAQRVQGVKAALSGLGDLTSGSAGKGPSVKVLLSGFSGTFNTAPRFQPGVVDPFQTLNAGTLPVLYSEADSFAALNQGAWTDYGLAFQNAREVLADQAALETAHGGPAPCQALVFFTDGMYDVAGGPSAIAAGKRLLCKPGGLTDELRADGVETFTLGLQTQMQLADSSFISAVADGGGPGCGTTGSPATGLYLPVQDSRELFLLFGNLFTPRAPPIQSSELHCDPQSCRTQSGSFNAVAGISSFVLRASMPSNQVALVLQPPSGPAIFVRSPASTSVSASGADLSGSWSSGTDLELNGTFPGGVASWNGRWSYSFVGPATGGVTAVKYTLHLQADVVPTLVGSPAFTLGEPEELRLELTDGSGNPITTGPLANADVSARVTDPSTNGTTSLAVSASGAGTYGSSFTAPLTSTAGSLSLSLAAAFPPLSGVTISTQTRVYSIPRKFPAFYPMVTPLSLELPSVTGAHTTSGILTVRGDPRVGGCVWFSASTTSAPVQARSIEARIQPSAASSAPCLPVPAGGEVQVTVSFTNRHNATGAVRGTLLSHLSSAANPKVQLLSIPVSYSLRTPKNVLPELGIVVGLLLAGILVSLLILHLVNVFMGRFTAPELLRAGGFDVTVRPHDAVYVQGDDLTPFELPDRISILRNRRRPHREANLRIDGLQFHRVATAQLRNRLFRLFQGPIGMVRNPGNSLVGGSAGGTARRFQSGDLLVPLALGGTWLFRPSPGPLTGRSGDQSGAEAVTGRLTVVLRAGGGSRHSEALQRTIETQLPEEVEGLAVNWTGSSGGTNGVPDTSAFDEDPTEARLDGGQSAGHEI